MNNEAFYQVQRYNKLNGKVDYDNAVCYATIGDAIYANPSDTGYLLDYQIKSVIDTPNHVYIIDNGCEFDDES